MEDATKPHVERQYKGNIRANPVWKAGSKTVQHGAY